MKKINIGTYSQKGFVAAPRADRPVERVQGTNKYSTKRKFHISKKFFIILLIFLLLGGGAAAYFRFKQVSERVQSYDDQGQKVECLDILNPSCWTEAFKPQLKQTDGFTNVLIIGLDTRTNKNSGLKNTDSIIVASFDHKTQQTMLISIPRDFYVREYHFKINAVYALTSKTNKDDEYFYLKEMVSKITNLPIHYFAAVHFDGVINGIDKLGGIQVCPADAFTAKYPNDAAKPSDPQQWLYYDFDKGCQTVDGERALVYARFRSLRRGPNYLASDFSRARRQQEVIGAVKEKILNQDMSISERAQTYWELLGQFKDSVILQGFSFEDLLAGLSYLNSADRSFINVVLDPNFGGLNKFIITDSNLGIGYSIRAKDLSYKTIQAELLKVRQFSDFYRETPRIVIRNMTGEAKLPAETQALKIKTDTAYYYSYDLFNDKKQATFAGMKIFDLSGGTKPLSIAFLKKFLNYEGEVETTPEKYGIERSNKKEDILIVIGPDTLPSPTATLTPIATP